MASVYEPPGSVAQPSWMKPQPLQASYTPQQWANTQHSNAMQTQGPLKGWTTHYMAGNNVGSSSPVAGGNNVYAALGAGYRPDNGANAWGNSSMFGNNSPTAQLYDMSQAQGQRQAQLAQAAQMRNTNTPGGVDAWHNNMMQGLGRAYQQMVGSSPMGQQAQAAQLRNTNTPGGVDQWMQQMRGGR